MEVESSVWIMKWMKARAAKCRIAGGFSTNADVMVGSGVRLWGFVAVERVEHEE